MWAGFYLLFTVQYWQSFENVSVPSPRHFFFGTKIKWRLVGQWLYAGTNATVPPSEGEPRTARLRWCMCVCVVACCRSRPGAGRRLACPWGCLLGGKPPVVADKCSVLAWLGWSGVAWQAGKNWMLCWLACCLLGGLVSLFQPLCYFAGLLCLVHLCMIVESIPGECCVLGQVLSGD
jgi:hypothetical protein